MCPLKRADPGPKLLASWDTFVWLDSAEKGGALRARRERELAESDDPNIDDVLEDVEFIRREFALMHAANPTPG